MVQITDDEFEQLVQEAVAAIPERFAERLNNVAFLVADEPTREQIGRNVRRGQTLLGLYEGVPLPKRGNGYTMVPPDVITVFRGPHVRGARSLESLRAQVHNTVWHEVAHYFGLDHGAIRELER
ncbi:MAG TPA: metallopeptidase family protein [Candidatus Saccharimonas sp.]|nr:metallopeptidase family protein [Candidatus Saccharimonas sp.]